MAEKIDDLTIEFFEGETLVVEQVDKRVLTRGSWSTIMFKFRERDKNTGEFGPEKVSIRRYQKRGGVFRQQSKFNISSAKQAMEVVKVLNDWFANGDSPSAASGSDDAEADD